MLKKYKEIIDLMPETVFTLDSKYNVTYVNVQGLSILGYDMDKIPGLSFFDVIAQDYYDETKDLLNSLTDDSTEGKVYGEVCVKDKDEHKIPARISISKIIHDRTFIGLIVILFDISARKKLEDKLIKSEERMRRLSDMALEGIVFYKRDGTITDVNQGYLDMFRYSRDEVLGKNIMDFAFIGHHDAVYEYIKKGSSDQQELCEIKGVRKSGDTFDVAFLTRSFIMDGEKQYAVVVQDNTHKKKFEFLKSHDELTGLFNKRGFSERLKNEIDFAKNKGKKLAIMCIKVFQDEFNVIKDVDQDFERVLLRAIPMEVSEKLKAILFKEDVVARTSENEFMTLHPLPGNIGLENTVTLIKKVMDMFNQEFVQGIKLVSRIGVTFYPDDFEMNNPNVILNNSRYACEEAVMHKKEYMFYDENSHRETRERIEFVNDLILAVKNEKCANFMLFYQPKVDKHGKIKGAEALIRWNSEKWNIPGAGFVPPGKFIGVAEEIGLIGDIGNWVLYEASRQMKEWQQMNEAFSRLNISINVSPSQLNEDFIDIVNNALEETGLPPETLEVEITERETIKDKNAVILSSLRRRNISVAIDDFGIDYSSLSKLPTLSIDTIKLDKSYIDNIATDSRYDLLVRYTIKMVHGFNYHVVAEGVEDEEQARKLFEEMDCDEVQGFFYFRPMPVDKFEKELYQNLIG